MSDNSRQDGPTPPPEGQDTAPGPEAVELEQAGAARQPAATPKPIEEEPTAGAGPAGTPPDGTDRSQPQRVDRSTVIGEGLKTAAGWSVRLLVLGFALWVLFWLLGQLWVGVRPVLFALIVSTVLWPVAAWLRRHGWPPAAAAGVVLLTSLFAVVGLLALVVQPMIAQTIQLSDSAISGLEQVQEWLTGPPVNLADERVDAVVAELTGRLRSSGAQIAAGVFSGVSAVGSGLVTLVLVLVLTFFFIKDGPAFLPWLRRETGPIIGGHLTEVLARAWRTLGDFIRVQAIVSFVDAFFIGLGLVILGVPLAPALAVLTFFAGFVPIVGAVTAGGLAVLIALVSNGPTTALIVLAIIIVVQQLESNVLQPVLQGRSLRLHAAIVLLAVTAGGTLFGIIGAFLAVPFAAVSATVLRYVSEQISLRTGEIQASEIRTTTPEGSRAAEQGEHAAGRFRRLTSRRRSDPAE